MQVQGIERQIDVDRVIGPNHYVAPQHSVRAALNLNLLWGERNIEFVRLFRDIRRESLGRYAEN